MTSREIKQFIIDDKVSQLYTIFKKPFDIIDKWADEFIDGDLLDENQLAHCLDQSTGINSKLSPVVNAFESYMERILNNIENSFYKKLDKVNAQAVSQAKAEARSKVSDIREWLGDFRGYLDAAKQNILSSQSRLKRLTVEKGAKRVGYTGEVPVGGCPGGCQDGEEPTIVNLDNTKNKPPNEVSWGE